MLLATLNEPETFGKIQPMREEAVPGSLQKTEDSQ
jgi:hypothetical protein